MWMVTIRSASTGRIVVEAVFDDKRNAQAYITRWTRTGECTADKLQLAT